MNELNDKAKKLKDVFKELESLELILENIKDEREVFLVSHNSVFNTLVPTILLLEIKDLIRARIKASIIRLNSNY